MKEKLIRFMQGRYGVDMLNQHILYLTIFLLIINMFVGNLFISVIAYGLWFVSIYRMFSKKVYVRYRENEAYKAKIAPITNRINRRKRQKADKEHRYFKCPNCKQTVRVPINRGRIVITCPKCQNKFEKRT